MIYLLILGLLSPFIFYAIFRKALPLIIPVIVAGFTSYEVSSFIADLSAWGDGATVKTVSNLSVFSFFYLIVLLFNGLPILPVWLIEKDRQTRKTLPEEPAKPQ